MPGWHEQTRALREAGDVRMVGIVEEQHPDRARLFMQWKEMGWPVLTDPLDLLGVSYVPITLLIDENGVIRRMGRLQLEDVEAFLAETYPPIPTPLVARPEPLTPETVDRLKPGRFLDPSAWTEYGEALALWGGDRLDDAIAAFSEAVKLDPEDGWAEFRLGVVHRMRYDSEGGDPGDFGAAVRHWSRALELDPNNYIWMRRLQQYGPREEKPYPFYDWVSDARSEIETRGETPVALPVEPRGAELAHPADDFRVAEAVAEPDPEGKIHRDEEGYVRVESTTVPVRIGSARSARVHLEFRPAGENDAHWNNEVGGLTVWIDPPEGWAVDQRLITVLPPTGSAVSNEIRRVEFEIRSPESVSGPGEIKAYALYYVCEGRQGQCLFRRQDLSLQIATRPDPQ